MIEGKCPQDEPNLIACESSNVCVLSKELCPITEIKLMKVPEVQV